MKTPVDIRFDQVWKTSSQHAKTFAGILHSRLWGENKNFIVAVVGEPGAGKSYSAISLAEMIDPNFSVDKITWDIEEFLKTLDRCGKGDVLILDEAGVGIPAREWQTLQNKAMSYVMQTFRYKNVGVILTTPSIEYIDRQVRGLVHYVVHVIDRKGNQNMCVVYRRNHDPVRGFLYWDKWIFYDPKSGRELDPNPIFIGKPSDWLIEVYEERSQQRKEKIRADALETYQAFKEGLSVRHSARTVREMMKQSEALKHLYHSLKEKYSIPDARIAEIMEISPQTLKAWKKEWS